MSEDAVGDYIPVDINLIRPESIAGFSIYLSSRNGYALFRDSNTQFDQGALSQLTDAGVATVYVKKDDQESLDQYYLDTLQGLLNDPASSLSQKTKAICSSSAAMARELLMRPTGVELGRARSLMESTVIELVNVPETLYELILATDTNYSLHTHMVNSTVYTLALCEPLAISDPEEMQVYALSGFLHDIGKSQLPESLLHKAGKLDSSEWTMMRQHPLLGFNMLAGFSDLPAAVAEAARGHHERMDGAGYPDGLAGQDIPFPARVAAVVDVFNALISETPFRKRMTSFDAIVLMRDGMKGQFDPDVLKALVVAIGQHARATAG